MSFMPEDESRPTGTENPATQLPRRICHAHVVGEHEVHADAHRCGQVQVVR
jgi:hypothetical protein